MVNETLHNIIVTMVTCKLHLQSWLKLNMTHIMRSIHLVSVNATEHIFFKWVYKLSLHCSAGGVIIIIFFLCAEQQIWTNLDICKLAYLWDCIKKLNA